MKNIQWLVGKRKVVALIGSVLMGICCACLMLGIAISSTPSGRATSTARAEMALTEEARPTDTPLPSKTPKPTNTIRPTNTNRPAATPVSSPTAPKPTAMPTLTATLKPTSIPATHVPLPTNTQAPIIIPTDTQVPQPTGFTLVNLSSPISAGSNANATIQTVPGASCYLGYTAPSGRPSTAQGLGATTADGNGICSWTWRIGSNTDAGTGSLAITANGVTQYFQIVIQ